MLLWTSGSQNCLSMASSLGGAVNGVRSFQTDARKQLLPLLSLLPVIVQSTEKSCGGKVLQRKRKRNTIVKMSRVDMIKQPVCAGKTPGWPSEACSFPQANWMRCQLSLVLSAPVSESGPPARDNPLLIRQFINILYNSWSLTYSLHPTEGSRS